MTHNTSTSIQITLDGLSFYLPEQDDLIFLPYNEQFVSQEVLQLIEQISNTTNEITVRINNENIITIPDPLYDPQISENYLLAKSDTLEGQTSIINRSKDIVFITSINSQLFELINQHFSSIIYTHACENLISCHTNSSNDGLYYDITENSISIAIFKELKLLFCETLHISDPNDAMYYVTKLTREHDMNDCNLTNCSFHNKYSL